MFLYYKEVRTCLFRTKNALPAWEGVRTMYSQTEMIFQAHQSRSSAITALTNL